MQVSRFSSSPLFEDPTIVAPRVEPVPAQPSSQFRFPLKHTLIYIALFILPIAGALGVNNISEMSTLASSTSTLNSPIADISTQQANAIVPVSANTQQGAQQIEYELSLANGFLQKAIDLSNQPGDQTVAQKDNILSLLNQSLEAAQRAVTLAPNDARGYSSRGRVYLASAAVKPEMKTLAEQDFAKAQSLGAQQPAQAPNTQNPIDLLPTQQAQTQTGAMVAGPNDEQKENIDGTVSQNATRGTVTLETGKSEIFVPYTLVKDSTQLYVTAENNPDNATIFVKNKEAGVGFTIAVTSASSAPLTITWWEIQ